MLALIVIVLLVWVIVGLIGFLVKGLLWLGIIAVVLFLLTAVFGGYRGGKRRGAKV